jgi:putative ABC transport system substrate-binding protein
MIGRRRFVEGAAVCVLFRARAILAQPANRVYRVGVLRPGTETRDVQTRALPNALRDLGYVESRNLVLVQRFAAGNLDRLPAMARELVDQRVDVIVAVSAGAITAVKAATSTTPIIFFGNFDPVAAGFVASLAHPGGNITGILIAPGGTLAGKKLELLTQAVPGTRRVAMLLPDDPNSVREQLPEARKAAAALGVQLIDIAVRGGDYANAFARIAATRPDSLFVTATSYFVTDRKPIIELAAKYRLPAIYEWPEQVEDGGLMAYGPSSLTGIYRRIASYVDQILKGAKPGDLPVEQPSKLEFVINLKTAKALGLSLPQSLLLRADRLIE